MNEIESTGRTANPIVARRKEEVARVAQSSADSRLAQGAYGGSTYSTRATMDCRVLPSFQDGSGSAALADESQQQRAVRAENDHGPSGAEAPLVGLSG
jgi:hypothetical protein